MYVCEKKNPRLKQEPQEMRSRAIPRVYTRLGTVCVPTSEHGKAPSYTGYQGKSQKGIALLVEPNYLRPIVIRLKNQDQGVKLIPRKLTASQNKA